MSDTSIPAAASVSSVVEQVSVWFSSLGAPRSAGQMFGYLLVCDPAEQSAAEIAGRIGISRAAVSSSARLLASVNAIEERHRVGDRRTYYRLRRDWSIRIATAKLGGFELLAETARAIRAGGGLVRTDGLDELIEFSEFWNGEIPRIAERWHRRHDEREDA